MEQVSDVFKMRVKMMDQGELPQLGLGTYKLKGDVLKRAVDNAL